MRSIYSSVLSLGFALALSGCELIAAPDRSLIPESSGGAPGTSGGGGAGGEAVPGGGGSGGVSDVGGAGGAGGVSDGGTLGGAGGMGGAGSECQVASDCPDTDNACIERTCNNGYCGTSLPPNGTPVGNQTAGDCRKRVCDGSGTIITTVDSTDVLDDSNDCTSDVCQGLTPKNNLLAEGTSCAQDGGQKCDTTGTCVECLANGDCNPSTEECNLVTKSCSPTACFNDVVDGDESDVDCGGSCGSNCAAGKLCGGPADCASSVCTTGTCVAPLCNDLVQNGTETDVDCGGSCAPCNANDSCSINSDCKGNECSGSTCVPNCADQQENGDETDTDCGGGTCADCTVGDDCTLDSDCSTDVCQSLVCRVAHCGDGDLDGADGETAVDCGGTDCAGCENHLACNTDDDCASGTCISGTCFRASCENGVIDPATETDLNCGGDCPPCADGLACLVTEDCANLVCDADACRPATCGNDVHNFELDETDNDCGGPDCATCVNGLSCFVDGDCASGACLSGVCRPMHCETVDVGDETDTNCGGSCPTCSNGNACSINADCTSTLCLLNVCLPVTCNNNATDGDETDEDCGGTCAPCALTKACLVNNDCISLNCDTNICVP